MQNNTTSSNSGLFFGIISLVSSVLSGFSLLFCCITSIISLIIGIPFGLLAIFLGVLGIIFGKIGVSQAKKSNSSLLLPKTGLVLGNIIVCIFFLGFLVALFMISFALLS